MKFGVIMSASDNDNAPDTADFSQELTPAATPRRSRDFLSLLPRHSSPCSALVYRVQIGQNAMSDRQVQEFGDAGDL